MPRDGDWASLLWREAPPHSTSPAAMSAPLPGSGWRQPVMCDSHHQCVTHATALSSDERCFLHDCTMETGTQLSLVIRHKCSTDVVGQVQNSSGPWNFCWLSFSWCSHNSQPSSKRLKEVLPNVDLSASDLYAQDVRSSCCLSTRTLYLLRQINTGVLELHLYLHPCPWSVKKKTKPIPPSSSQSCI